MANTFGEAQTRRFWERAAPGVWLTPDEEKGWVGEQDTRPPQGAPGPTAAVLARASGPLLTAAREPGSAKESLQDAEVCVVAALCTHN